MSDLVTHKDCFDAQTKMQKKIEEVKDEISDLKVVIAALPDDLIERLDKRYAERSKVDALEDSIKWANRLIIGAVIMAIMALVLRK